MENFFPQHNPHLGKASNEIAFSREHECNKLLFNCGERSKNEKSHFPPHMCHTFCSLCLFVCLPLDITREISRKNNDEVFISAEIDFARVKLENKSLCFARKLEEEVMNIRRKSLVCHVRHMNVKEERERKKLILQKDCSYGFLLFKQESRVERNLREVSYFEGLRFF